MAQQAASNIKVDYLARVEGEGSIAVDIQDGEVTKAHFGVFEPPRFFEAFLQGRNFTEAPDITSRICGICPIAYQTSAIQAMENALGIRVEGQVRALRRLIYCGEWIESNALHVHLLHGPGFLGYSDAFEMAKQHRAIVERGLKIKKYGNEIMSLIGGRQIHPINVRVGGFFKAPNKRDLLPLAEKLKWARDAAFQTVRWAGTLPFPDFERDYEFVSMRSSFDEYPITEGRIVSSRGLDIPVEDYEKHFTESHVARSNALHSTKKDGEVEGGKYFVGPLARFNLNFDRLSPIAQEAANLAGCNGTVKNPFKSIIVRSVEVLYAIDEALRLIDQYEPPLRPAYVAEPNAATGYGSSEAPRGLLYHRYRIDEEGTIQEAKIVPPTSQNQKMIESDLREFVKRNKDLPEDKLTWMAEQAVRNYDPCISCSTHMLKVTFIK